MRDLTSKISNLSVEKRALLEKRLQQRTKASLASNIPIPQRDKSIPVPLSFMQERLWFLHQLDPELNAYNESSTYVLRGKLEVSALRHSFEVVIARHEILRTVYQELDGVPVQVVQPIAPVHLEVVDLSALPPKQRSDELKDALEKQVRKPFNLVSDSVIRVVLYRLEDEEHILLCVIHHIASDGWSLALLWKEIFRIYEADVRGEAAALSALPIQYADFAAWQRRWFNDEVMQQHLQYWRTALQGLAPADLPLDQQREERQTYRGVELRRKVPSAVMQKVYEISRLENVTPFMILLTAFYMLLSRLTGKEDIAVGTPVVNRRFLELEQMIGFFVNTLVARANLAGNPSFRDVLERVRSMLLDVFDHQEMPFEKLVENLQLERLPNRTPFFQAFFNFIPRQSERFELASLQAERVYLVERSAKFDFTLYVIESSSGTELDLTYNADLFSQIHMDELINQYLSVLAQSMGEQNLSIDSYSLVTDNARRILPDPGKELPEPEHPPVTEMFLRQVADAPSAIAVEQEGQRWSYAQLATRAQQIAREILSWGIECDQVLAVHGPRSFDLVASALGVFMSGGVLLLIDPDLPAARQEMMMQSTQAILRLRVVEGSLELPEFEFFGNSKVVRRKTIPVEPRTLPDIKPEDRAYIFFTSGSTGAPKGIQGLHKGLSHFLNWQRTKFDIGVHDRVGQLTHLSFDVVLRDLFTILVSGGTLVLPPSDGIPPQDVLAWLAEKRITLLHTVPSLARFWLDASSEPVSLSSLRLSFFAGEMLSGELVNRWRKLLTPESVLINLYGPTETTLAKAFYRVPESPDPGYLPVGVPLPQTQLLVLTTNGMLCGVGEPGQVAIRTPFTTQGYLPGVAEQSRFISSPFSNEKPNTLYLTGDRGRYRSDGTLEIFGRMDDQVKVRGVLIQPQEVAAVLQSHPDIAGCYVRGFETSQGSSELAAYLVPIVDRKLEAEHVRTFLRGRLPLTMLPAALVIVDKLPLLPNGKVDRNALPEPRTGIVDASRTYLPPRTPIEQVLAQIWQEVLKVQRVSKDDNFFDLGGHSLLAMRVIARIRQTFQIELALRELFELPTIAGLAGSVELSLEKMNITVEGSVRDEGEI